MEHTEGILTVLGKLLVWLVIELMTQPQNKSFLKSPPKGTQRVVRLGPSRYLPKI